MLISGFTLLRAHVGFTRMTMRYAFKKAGKKKISIDSLGAWDNKMDLPLLLEQSIKRGKPIPKICANTVGLSSVQGRRPKNEDRFLVRDLPGEILLVGLFDGHGGHEAADFCCQHLEAYVANGLRQGKHDLEELLENVFLKLNDEFAIHVDYRGEGSTGGTVGTTATVCMLRRGSELVMAHVGDSRAVLSRAGEAKLLTIKHSPHNPSEKDRVEKSGGFVKLNKSNNLMVCGKLAMTRSLGDLDLKRFGVTPMPHTRSLEIKHGQDNFLILTTDGVNDVMTNVEVVAVVARSATPLEGAEHVTDQALQYATADNATAVVVPLGSWGKNKDSSPIFYSFGKSMAISSRFS